MTVPTASQRKKQPKAPKVPVHSIFLGLYIDKPTNAMLAKIAKTEKTSRSFIVRKLLTEILAKYDTQHAHNLGHTASTAAGAQP